jgi:hypothetical protein
VKKSRRIAGGQTLHQTIILGFNPFQKIFGDWLTVTKLASDVR